MKHAIKTKAEYEAAVIKRDTPRTTDDPITVEELLDWHDLNVSIKEFEYRIASLDQTKAISESGYGGVNGNGTIVDRRKEPKAVAIPANRLFNTPPPKKV